MEIRPSNEVKNRFGLYRLIDRKQPEVKWALSTSILFEIFFICVSFQPAFTIFAENVHALLHCLIGGIAGLIGVAVAGVAIVIALFSPRQIDQIEQLYPGAFEEILHDFKWFAQFSAIEIAVLIVVDILICIPCPVAPVLPFYFALFAVIYSIFYLLFYGFSLISNFIKMSSIKRKLDAIALNEKPLPVSILETELDFLISRIFNQDKDTARKYYGDMISTLEKSEISNKDAILSYLREKLATIK